MQVEPAFGRDEAYVCITLLDGTRLEHHVEHASGTRQNPMTDTALQTKFMANAQPCWDQCESQELLQAVWALEHCADVTALVALCAPSR